MNPELLKLLVPYLGVSLVSVVLGALFLTLYPNAKTVFGDLLKTLGWVGKWLRRASVSSEIEGSLSLFARKYNGELTNPFLPECEIKWVTDENVEAYWNSGKLIVKVSFGEDHDKNFLAAATSFVRTGLLPRAKSYMSRVTVEALNLFLTKTILSDSRRTALTQFNDAFRGVDADCREVYYKLEEIDSKRLLRRVLLQEYYFFGEAVGDLSPRNEHSSEADGFLNWLFGLASREADDASQLSYRGEYIRVGVILVAREDTFRQHGVGPYIRRANTYASEGFQTIYLLSRGTPRSAVTKAIARNLVSTGNFTELTDLPDLIVKSRDVPEIVTIIPLRADLVGIAQSAWERFRAAGKDEEFTVVIESVTEGSVLVNAFGVRAEMPLEDLSALQITDARKYFSRFQELQVRLLEASEEGNTLRFSNRDSATDPKRVIDSLQGAFETGAEAEVIGYRDIDGFEIGLYVKLSAGIANGYIPRSGATYSRFIPLSEKFERGSHIRAKVLEFQPAYNSFLCEVADRHDPWVDYRKYTIGNNYPAVLRQTAEQRLVYEIEEGLDGVVFVDEVDWKPLHENLDAIKQKTLGEPATVQILGINPDARQLRLSLKRVQESPSHTYFRSNKGAIAEVEVIELLPRGAHVRILGDGHAAWLPVGELSWLFCNDPSLLLSVSQIVAAKVIDYKPADDRLFVSVRQIHVNEYEEIERMASVGDVFQASVIHRIGASVSVNLMAADGRACAGYVHKAEVTNLAFVNDNELTNFLPVGESFPVVVKKFDDRHRIIEVSRKEYLRKALESLEYGEVFPVRIAHVSPNRTIATGVALEGRLVNPGRRSIGEMVNVVIARLGKDPRDVELTLGQ